VMMTVAPPSSRNRTAGTAPNLFQRFHFIHQRAPSRGRTTNPLDGKKRSGQTKLKKKRGKIGTDNRISLWWCWQTPRPASAMINHQLDGSMSAQQSGSAWVTETRPNPICFANTKQAPIGVPTADRHEQSNQSRAALTPPAQPPPPNPPPPPPPPPTPPHPQPRPSENYLVY